MPIELKIVTPAEYAGALLPDQESDSLYAAPYFEPLTRLSAALSLIEIYYDPSHGLDEAEQEERRHVLMQSVERCQRTVLPDTFSLCDEVRALIAHAEEGVRRSMRRPDSASLPLNDFTRAHGRRPICVGCGAGSPCIGSPDHDRSLVNHEPRCLRVLREAFLRAVRAAETMYGAYAPWCNRPLMTTMKCFEGKATGLQGTTQHHVNGTLTLGAQIEVELPVASATVENYPVLEWMLLHEVAVHGVQAAARDHRPDGAGHCAFTEGLVDRTIRRLYVSKYMNAASPSMPMPLLKEVHKTIDGIEAVRIGGGGGLRDAPQDVRRPIQLGYDACRSLERILADEEIATLVLSLHLELSTAPGAGERERFLEQVDLDAGLLAQTHGMGLSDTEEQKRVKKAKYLSALKYLKGRRPIQASRLSNRLAPAIAGLLAEPPASTPKPRPALAGSSSVSPPQPNSEPLSTLLDDGCPY